MVSAKSSFNFVIGFTVLLCYIFLSSPVPFQPAPTDQQQFVNHFTPLYTESFPTSFPELYQFLFTPLQFCPDIYYVQYASSKFSTKIQPIFEHISDPQSITTFYPTNGDDFQFQIQPVFQLLDKYRHNACQLYTTTLLSFYHSVFGINTDDFYSHPLAPTTYSPARIRDQQIAQIASNVIQIYPAFVVFTPSLLHSTITPTNETDSKLSKQQFQQQLQYIPPVPSIYGTKSINIPIEPQQWNLSIKWITLDFTHFYSYYSTFLFIHQEYSKEFYTTLFSIFTPLLYVLKLFFSTPFFAFVLAPTIVMIHKLKTTTTIQPSSSAQSTTQPCPTHSAFSLFIKRFSSRAVFKFLIFIQFAHIIISSIILNKIFSSTRSILSTLINLFRGKFSNYLRSTPSSPARVEQFADTEIQVLSAFILVLITPALWPLYLPMMIFSIVTFPVTILMYTLYPSLRLD